jgi:hypothetical protein
MTPASLRHLIRALNEPPRIVFERGLLSHEEIERLSTMRTGDVVAVSNCESLRVIPQRTITIRIGASTPRATAAMGPTLRARRRP